MDFTVTGTHVWYYYICKREVWLMIHQLESDQDDENLQIGRIIGEHSYKRDKKEVNLGHARIDLLRKENGQIVIGEIKKSSRFIESASKQLLFYLFQFKQMGIDVRGELLIPEEKEKIDVILNEESEAEISKAIKAIEQIAEDDFPPEPVRNKYCRKCAYSEFCWA